MSVRGKGAHLTPEKLLSRLGVRSGTLGRFALIPGPKERSQKILQALENPTRSFSFLDYEMHTGTYDGKRVSVGNGGRYAPDSAMTTEILCAGGVESLIRIGSCGSLQKEIKIGDLIIATGALRGEGTTAYYVAKNFSTLSDPELVGALTEAAKSLKVRYHLGRVYTTDALFCETPELIEELEQQRVSGIDMVTSAFLTVAQLRCKKAAAIMAVSDECLSGQIGFHEPAFLEAEEKMVEVALKTIRLLS